MATLTYNPAEEQEGEFTEQEQENIKVGEALEEQQNQLLAGKFKDAEDLEKGYIELQKKLGEPKEEAEVKQEVETVEKELESVLSLIAQSIDRLQDVSSRLDGGMRELVSDVDLAGMQEIQEIIREMPEDLRKDPRNSPYFDRLEKVLSSLAD